MLFNVSIPNRLKFYEKHYPNTNNTPDLVVEYVDIKRLKA